MLIVVVSVHIVVCVLLILVVLLQAGKGSGMGSALGGSNQAFIDSGSASGILSKATTVAAIIFMLTSITMGYIRGKNSTSVMDGYEVTSLSVEESSDLPLTSDYDVTDFILEKNSEILHSEEDLSTRGEDLLRE